MKRTITEASILVASVTKWIVLATCAGGIVGLAATVFLKLLAWSTELAGRYSFTFFFLPLALFLSSLLTTYFAPDARGHGMEKVIEAIHKHGSVIPGIVVPVKLVATVLTIALGGSAGKEGPCAQIGAALASQLARLLRFEEADRRKLVICGISAGFAAVFGTPMAGAIFSVEVLIVGTLLYDVVLPSFVAGLASYLVTTYFGVSYIHFFITVPALSVALFLKVILAGIVFGGMSVLLIKGMQIGQRFFDAVNLWPPLKAFGAGFALALLAVLFGDQYLGLGVATVVSVLNGRHVSWTAPFLKIAFTSITLNSGGSGGVVMPIFFVGSTSGAFLGHLLNTDIRAFAAIGCLSLLAGAANTPIAASIMAVEMFGPSIGPYAAVACVISFLMTGHRSVYPSQLFARRKSATRDVPIRVAGNQVSASHPPESKTSADVFVPLWQWLAGRLQKSEEMGRKAANNHGEGR